MKNILIGMVLVAVVFCSTNAWAITKTATVNVNATVPTVTGGLTVSVSKIISDVWSSATVISFGTLVLDPTFKVFRPAGYYAIDVGVEDNTGSAWTVTHTRASLASGSNNLNDKVNVSFNKQTSAKVGTELQKVSFGNSNNVAYTKTQLSGGWLRIYYGIGTGSGDATGVTPIGLDTPAGTYTGSVTLTLTP